MSDWKTDLDCMMECMSDKEIDEMRSYLGAGTKKEMQRGKKCKGDIYYKDDEGVWL